MKDGRRQWVLVVVCSAVLITSIDALVLNVALPTLVRDLDASTAELQWIVDAYILVFAGFLLVGGSLGDRFGRAKVMELGMVVFGVASGIAAFSSSATALIVCRGVMGLGAALIMPTSVAVLTNVFESPRERGRALGVWSASAGLGIALGPVVGGLLLSQFWWGSVFLVNVPLVGIALAIALWAVPESRNPEVSKFDPLGIVLSVLAVSALVWATIQAPTDGWASTTTLRNFTLALALLVAFVVWELRSTHPMLELHFFRDRHFTVASIASAIANYSFAGMMFVLTQLLQFVFGYTPLAAGFALMPMAVAFMTAGLSGPRLAERIGTRRSVSAALATFGFALVILGLTTEDTTLLLVLVATMLVGVGFGLTMAPTTDTVMGAVPREQAGVASGTLSTTRQVGTALGVAVVGSLLVSGYRTVFDQHLDGVRLSGKDAETARTSLGSALTVARDVGGTAGRVVADAARAGFLHGMRIGMFATAVLLGIGSVLALRYLPARAHEGLTRDEVSEVPALDVVTE